LTGWRRERYDRNVRMGAEGPEVSPLAALPSRFGKYTILGHLATGGMAEVYLARAEGIEGFEKIVVIKRIRPELTGDRSTTRMFLHEARLAASLEHPNIAHVHEIDIVQGNYFFVMEYVHGADDAARAGGVRPRAKAGDLRPAVPARCR
jgi:eukaryotic-like serine/threonine-protein kinase